MGLKSELSPRGHETKEAGLESEPSPHSHAITDLQYFWLCKLSAWGTSEWTAGAPVAGTGVALAAVGFAEEEPVFAMIP